MEKTINISYDDLSWFGEDKEKLHALNLTIEDIKYDTPLSSVIFCENV